MAGINGKPSETMWPREGVAGSEPSGGRSWLELAEAQTCTKPKVIAIIPAFNEEGRVGRVIHAIPREVVDEVIVVDDHSTDSTAIESLKAGALVVSQNGPRGVGAALKAGYCEAVRRGGGIFLVLAGDMQHDPSEIPKLVKPIQCGQADYVTGDRLSNAPVAQGMPPLRYVGNVILTFLTRLITGLDVKDSQCGFTAVTRQALGRIDILWLSDLWGITNGLLAECGRNNMTIVCVPVSTHYGSRRSYIRPLTYLRCMVLVLLRAFLRARTRTSQK